MWSKSHHHHGFLTILVTFKKSTFLWLFHKDQELYKSRRERKSHQCFDSYSHFTEGVDFAYWWSCIWKGLRLQRAQQACFTKLCAFFWAYFPSSVHNAKARPYKAPILSVLTLGFDNANFGWYVFALLFSGQSGSFQSNII